MEWLRFLNTLKPETKSQECKLKTILEGFSSAPDLFWYPGSGKDFVPLLLDVPNNPTGERMFRINQECTHNPILFWMNDHDESLRDFPINELLGQDIAPEYYELWQNYKSKVTIGKRKESYRLKDKITVTLFTANVKNRVNGHHARGDDGDEYLILFSACDSDILLNKVFVEYRFHLHVIALIKQGGFSNQKENFQHYRDLPKRISRLRREIGEVDFWCVDEYGQREPCYGRYEIVGGPVEWGWPPTRLYRKS